MAQPLSNMCEHHITMLLERLTGDGASAAAGPRAGTPRDSRQGAPSAAGDGTPLAAELCAGPDEVSARLLLL